MVQNLINMGQASSVPKMRKKSRLFTKKLSLKRKSLSHTFTWIENEDCNGVEKLNINLATEEELMTLNGITRDIAISIVEHRNTIGRFRKIEDLVVVPGMGANKLEKIKYEICVSKRNRHNSSRAHSYDSLKSIDSRQTVRSNKLINVNTATVFELQTINYINQEVAAAIVYHRHKKGNFSKLENLLEVKGIDRMLLANISKCITVDPPSQEDVKEPRPSILTNGYTMPKQNGITNGVPSSSILDIFELTSAYCPRPVMKEDFKYSHDGEPAIRVASWNLENFSVDKASNFGVKEVICRTILENGWSIVAVQNVTHVAALKVICEELNMPKLNRVKEWKDKHHYWNFCMLNVESSRLGFIYDSDFDIDLELLSLKEGPFKPEAEFEVLLGTFRIGDINLDIANVMLIGNPARQYFEEALKKISSDSEYLLTCVYFTDIINKSDRTLHLTDQLPVLSADIETRLFFRNNEAGGCLNGCNIFFNPKMEKRMTDRSGVVRHGLSHLSIPNGWNWGGSVSSYSPVWTEFLVSFSNGIDL